MRGPGFCLLHTLQGRLVSACGLGQGCSRILANRVASRLPCGVGVAMRSRVVTTRRRTRMSRGISRVLDVLARHRHRVVCLHCVRRYSCRRVTRVVRVDIPTYHGLLCQALLGLGRGGALILFCLLLSVGINWVERRFGFCSKGINVGPTPIHILYER